MNCRAVRHLTVLVFGALGLLAALAPPAHAQDDGWVIESFDVAMEVDASGVVTVTETIAVDFGTLQRHGIYRVIPVRYGLAPEVPFDLPEGLTSEDVVRAIDISGIGVDSPDAPDDVEISRPGPFPSPGEVVSIRIGDEDVTVSGKRTYVVSYRVEGAMNGFGTPPELNWNATGNGWGVPIRRASVTVGGVAPERTACFRGQFGATATCDASAGAAGAARFEAADLAPGEGMTVVLGYAEGAVDVPPPILLERWDAARAFAGSPWAWPAALLVSLLAFGGVAVLLVREGRDRVARGGMAVDGRLEPTGEGRRRRLFEPRPVPVQFRPPDGLRPAQLGLIIDERVDAVDVSATVVDLAVRGYILIEEEEKKVLWFSRTDWRLKRTNGPLDEADILLPYEQDLLDGLFDDGDQVLVSELKGEFAETYRDLEGQLYDMGKDEGWFPRRPDRVRALWLGLGIGATALGIGAFVLGMMFTTFAVAFLPLFPAGLVLAIGARAMPHRTPRGSALLTGTLGFREFIVTAEADRMDFAERERMFVEYLPYAVVFGAVDHWSRVFADLGIATSAAVGAWYVGAHGFDAARFSSGLSDFSSTVGSSLATVPASSGSSGFSGGGFSGGGFGGGGGGSW